MFSGIVTDVGRIERIAEIEGGRRFRIRAEKDMKNLSIGASVCHSGVCLTVVSKGSGWFESEAWEEALRLTTLGQAVEGDLLNLERSLRMGDEIGGHLVSGHVDAKAMILSVEPKGGAVRFEIETPEGLSRLIAPKGSVALDGVSLTVNGVDEGKGNRFDVLLIAHTLEVTSWRLKRKGDFVNLEVDPLARYAARILEADEGQRRGRAGTWGRRDA